MNAEETLARMYGYNGEDSNAFSKSLLGKADFEYAKAMALPESEKDIKDFIREIAPFIKASLENGMLCDTLNGSSLWSIVKKGSVRYISPFMGTPAFVAVNPEAGFETWNLKKRALRCTTWLVSEFGIAIIPDTSPMQSAFRDLPAPARKKPVLRFCKIDNIRSFEQ